MLRMDSVGKAAIAVLPVLFLMGCEAMRGEETAAVTPSTAEQTAQAAQQQAQQNAARIEQLAAQVQQAQDAATAAQRRADQLAEQAARTSVTTDRMMQQELRK
ncbi:MAG: hypothetical protein H3C38_04295 [Rhodospirillales bacterium]|nr:hypothetical protein [Rhodospirillales bacterium]